MHSSDRGGRWIAETRVTELLYAGSQRGISSTWGLEKLQITLVETASGDRSTPPFGSPVRWAVA
jgi:hypothetical protein